MLQAVPISDRVPPTARSRRCTGASAVPQKAHYISLPARPSLGCTVSDVRPQHQPTMGYFSMGRTSRSSPSVLRARYLHEPWRLGGAAQSLQPGPVLALNFLYPHALPTHGNRWQVKSPSAIGRRGCCRQRSHQKMRRRRKQPIGISLIVRAEDALAALPLASAALG